MSTYLIASPLGKLFTLSDQFKAIFDGSIYVGKVDQDPLNPTQQIAAYVVNEDGSRTQVALPIKTNSGGYAVYNGQPAKFVCDEPYSIVILNKNGAEAWRIEDITSVDPENLPHNATKDRNEVGAHDQIYDRHVETAAEVASLGLSVGDYIWIDDRDAAFKIKTGSPNGMDLVDAGGGLVAELSRTNRVNIVSLGADRTGVIDSTAIIKHAAEMLSSGIVYAPAGSYRVSNKLSLNKSGMMFIGDGPDLTYIRFYENTSVNYKTGVEINNGSWDDANGVYTSSGVSIGSSRIQNMSIVSIDKINATGVVFARATKQCSLDRVKIVGWDVPYRMYGAWYAKINNCSIESNVNGGRLGYETNDFTWFECDHTSNDNSHIEFEATGSCRRVQYIAGSLDGLPKLFGVYVKNTTSFSIRDTYLEIYGEDSDSAPFIQCGQLVFNVALDGIDLIFPTDNSYVGTAVKLGTGVGAGAIGVSLSNIRQYNSSNGVSIDTTNAKEVDFGSNIRVSSPIVGELLTEIQPSMQTNTVIPKTLGANELKVSIGVTKRAGYSFAKVLVNFTESINLAGRFIRIIREDTGDVLLNYALGAVIANTTIDIGTFTGVPAGVTILAYTYKVGSSIDWPATTVTMVSI